MTSVPEPSPRGRVLVAVEDHHSRTGEAVTAADLAEELALHPSTVRFHLRKLVDAEQITEETPADTATSGSGAARGDTRGRPRKRYRPAPPSPTDLLLGALVDALADTAEEREERAARAGRIWAATVTGTVAGSGSGEDPGHSGGTTDPLDAAAQVLTALGFEIQAMSSIFGTCEIRVCSCPLRSLGQRHPEVARGIQRGAVEHALASATSTDRPGDLPTTRPGDLPTARPGDWTVTSRPDPRFGDCEVTLRFSPTTALPLTRPTTPHPTTPHPTPS